MIAGKRQNLFGQCVPLNEALGADGDAPRALLFAMESIPIFVAPLAFGLKNDTLKKQLYDAKCNAGCLHQRLQLCGNPRCTSLNIMFLTHCKCCNFLAMIAVSSEIASHFYSLL